MNKTKFIFYSLTTLQYILVVSITLLMKTMFLNISPFGYFLIVIILFHTINTILLDVFNKKNIIIKNGENWIKILIIAILLIQPIGFNGDCSNQIKKGLMLDNVKQIK